MKAFKLILSGLIIFSITLLASCGGDDNDPGSTSETEIQKAVKVLVSGTWKVGTVTVDGVNKNDLFTSMTLNFTATGYTSANGEPVWPTSGTWTFVDETAKSVNRNDGVTVTLDALSEGRMTVSLNWTKTTLSGGRVSSIPGKHVFTFTK